MIYGISYKTLIDPKPLDISFNKIDGFTRIYDWTRHLTLFGSEKHVICNRIRYPIYLKSGIRFFFFFQYFAKIRVDAYDSLPMQKILTLHNCNTH